MKDQKIENRELAESGAKKRKQLPPEFMVLFWIFILGIVGFVFYQLFLQPSSQLTEEESLIQEQAEEENLLQEQLEEKGPASVLDTLSKNPEVGTLAPDFISEDVYGTKIALSDFRDKKPVLLVFWATWCGYCLKELEDLKAFADDHRDEIQVIAVSSGESKETIKNYIQEKNVNFPMVLDEDRKIWSQYLVRGTPNHFLIASSGKIVTLRPGLASKEDLEIMMTMLTELW